MTAGDGWRVPPRRLEELGVHDAADARWLRAHMVAHPLRSYQDRARVTAESRQIRSVYIECEDWMDVFASSAERARARGWLVRRLRAGHEAMVTAPGAVTDALVELELIGALPSGPSLTAAPTTVACT